MVFVGQRRGCSRPENLVYPNASQSPTAINGRRIRIKGRCIQMAAVLRGYQNSVTGTATPTRLTGLSFLCNLT